MNTWLSMERQQRLQRVSPIVQKKGKHHSSPTIYVMETTGKYYEDLFYFFIITGCEVSVQLAQKLTYFVKSNKLKTKTDKVVAKKIATFGLKKL